MCQFQFKLGLHRGYSELSSLLFDGQSLVDHCVISEQQSQLHSGTFHRKQVSLDRQFPFSLTLYRWGTKIGFSDQAPQP